MAPMAAPVTYGAAHAVVERINQYGHGSFLSRYCFVDSASACSAARVSTAGAASLICKPLRFLPTPLPAGFFPFFLSGCALLGAFRAAFFSTFALALDAGFFTTLARASPLSLGPCELPSFVCN